jgi:hypothetical protein
MYSQERDPSLDTCEKIKSRVTVFLLFFRQCIAKRETPHLMLMSKERIYGSIQETSLWRQNFLQFFVSFWVVF